MSTSRLQDFIRDHQLDAEIIRLETPTPTVETAAAAVGTTPVQIIKSVLFIINANPLLSIVCGTQLIDRRRIAAHLGVGRRRIKLADPETVHTVTGYPAGGVPPFGHPTPIETLIDPEVLKQAFVFGGGGDDHSLVRMKPEDILSITAATVLPLIAL